MKSEPCFELLHFGGNLSRLHIHIHRTIGRATAAIVHMAGDRCKSQAADPPSETSRKIRSHRFFPPLAFHEKDNGSLSGSLAMAVIPTGSPTVTDLRSAEQEIVGGRFGGCTHEYLLRNWLRRLGRWRRVL